MSRKRNGQQLHKRAKINGQVYIHNDDRLFIAPLSNISAGGIFINGVTGIQAGNVVRIVIKSQQMGKTIQCRGKVVRVERAKRRGLAIKFDGLPSEAQKAIKRCVEAQIGNQAAA